MASITVRAEKPGAIWGRISIIARPLTCGTGEIKVSEVQLGAHPAQMVSRWIAERWQEMEAGRREAPAFNRTVE